MSVKVNPNFFKELERKSKEALKKSAKVVQVNAKKHSPVDTGKLRDSIKIKETGDLEMSIGSDVEYAHIVEYGGLGRGGGRRTAHPYLRPGLAQSKSQIKRIFS